MTGVEHGAFGLKPTQIQPNVNILGLSLLYIFMKTFTDSLKNVRKKIFLPEILKILILILTHSLDQSKISNDRFRKMEGIFCRKLFEINKRMLKNDLLDLSNRTRVYSIFLYFNQFGHGWDKRPPFSE